ncbi:MAG TPA: hypothetical protein VLJ59_08980 [Mycobacteriales bacterium]|nr:hypothetical protein [Mycobacteriales bacterium]
MTAPAPPGGGVAAKVDARGVQGGQVGDRNEMHNHFYAGPSGVNWPVTVGRPPLRADAYQERPALRDALAAALAGGGTAVVTQVVAGDGGTGKTQLAAAAFERARGSADLSVWVTAATRSAVLSAYAEAFAATHPTVGPGTHNLAWWRGEAGDAAGAVTAFEVLLANRVRMLGPDHPHTLITRGDLDHLATPGTRSKPRRVALTGYAVQVVDPYARARGGRRPHPRYADKKRSESTLSVHSLPLAAAPR